MPTKLKMRNLILLNEFIPDSISIAPRALLLFHIYFLFLSVNVDFSSKNENEIKGKDVT